MDTAGALPSKPSAPRPAWRGRPRPAAKDDSGSLGRALRPMPAAVTARPARIRGISTLPRCAARADGDDHGCEAPASRNSEATTTLTRTVGVEMRDQVNSLLCSGKGCATGRLRSPRGRGRTSRPSIQSMLNTQRGRPVLDHREADQHAPAHRCTALQSTPLGIPVLACHPELRVEHRFAR